MPAYNGDEISNGTYQNNYGKRNAVYSPGKYSDDLDEKGKAIAQELSQKTNWNIQYGGTPVQYRYFTVSKGSGRSFEYHPEMPRAKSNFDANGWHINNVDKMLEILGVDL